MSNLAGGHRGVCYIILCPFLVFLFLCSQNETRGAEESTEAALEAPRQPPVTLPRPRGQLQTVCTSPSNPETCLQIQQCQPLILGSSKTTMGTSLVAQR